MSDLRERVARAIEATIRHAVEPDARANEMTPDELAMLADAAIAACRPIHRAEALEEAARVVDEYRHPNMALYPQYKGIASAIRALILSADKETGA